MPRSDDAKDDLPDANLIEATTFIIDDFHITKNNANGIDKGYAASGT